MVQIDFVEMKKKDLLYILLFLFGYISSIPNLPAQNKGKFKVTIDAGHGGKDPGCIGTKKVKEKNINLAIALKLGKLIRNNYQDIEVIYTRKTDVFVPLNKRTEIANRNKCDLFISIHADAVPSKYSNSAYGAGSFTLGTAKTKENLEVAKRENSVILLEDNYQQQYQGFDPNSAESYIMFETLQSTHQSQSIQLASFIQNAFRNKAKRYDRQVRQAPYLVLKTASMPAVLVETGFLSNPKEESFLSSEEGQQKIANAIFYGFSQYKDSFDRHNSSSIKRRRDNNTQNTAKEGNLEKQRSNPNIEEKDIYQQEASTEDNIISYKVQFLSYYKKLNKGATQLKGLWPVDYYKTGNTYRYTYGNTTDYNEILRLQRNVRKKFNDAFVIKFRNGERE